MAEMLSVRWCLFLSIGRPSDSSELPANRTLPWTRDSRLNLSAVSHIRLVNIFLIANCKPETRQGVRLTVATIPVLDSYRMRLQPFITGELKGTPSSFVNHLCGPSGYAFYLFYDKKGAIIPPRLTRGGYDRDLDRNADRNAKCRDRSV